MKLLNLFQSKQTQFQDLSLTQHSPFIKILETVNPVWEAQILSHLKLTGQRLGFLINFNVPLMKQGIRRFVN
ncbi:MAG: GxxExxY protein [Bacteroidetes bacterium]|nr:GxxExxY protein [Bacteroidota bacterium]